MPRKRKTKERDWSRFDYSAYEYNEVPRDYGILIDDKPVPDAGSKSGDGADGDVSIAAAGTGASVVPLSASFDLANFQTLITNPACPSNRFLDLDINDLYRLVESPDLVVKNERDVILGDPANHFAVVLVFVASLNWMKHKPEERRRHFAELFSNFRLCAFGYADLRAIQLFVMGMGGKNSNKHVAMVAGAMHCVHNKIASGANNPNFIGRQSTLENDEEFRLILSQTCKILRDPDGNLPEGMIDHQHSCNLRKCQMRVIVCVGGFCDDPYRTARQSGMLVYDINLDRWFPMPAGTHIGRGRFGLTGNGTELFAFGGGCYYDSLSAEKFDGQKWTSIAKMPQQRSEHAVVFGGNSKIYLIGDGNDLIEYDPNPDTYTIKAPMAQQRVGLAAGLIGDDVIYVAGGDKDGQYKTCESYTISKDKWTPIAPMNQGRRGAVGVVFGGHFYVFGGRESGIGDDYLNICEKYNPADNKWYPLPPMPVACWYAGAIEVTSDEICVVGGENVTGRLDTVQSFDLVNEKWSQMNPLPCGREGLGLAWLSGVSVDDLLLGTMADCPLPTTLCF